MNFKEDVMVCYCEKVFKSEILAAVQNGAKNVKDVVDATGACKTASRCEELNPQKRCCAIDIMQIISAEQ